MDCHVATEIPAARVAVWRFLNLCDPELFRGDPLGETLDRKIDRIRAVNQEQRRASHNVLLPLEIWEGTAMQTAASWPRWNAVEGPADRSDDVHADVLDRFTAGMTEEDAIRMRAIERFYPCFEDFAGRPGVPAVAELTRFSQDLLGAREVLAMYQPIAYRAEMWIQEGGRWRKRRQNDPI